MSENNLIDNLLQKASQEEEISTQKVSVVKQIDLEYDVGHLCACDVNAIDSKLAKNNTEAFLKALARDNTQLMINRLWDLDTKRVDSHVMASLPAPTTRLPRAKHVPKPKAPTKWEAFAKAKGINKKKKEKLVWDENEKDWKPKYGYKGANQTPLGESGWMVELNDNKDPNEDHFGKVREEKKERIAKNEYQRLRNIARNKKMKIVGTSGIIPEAYQTKDELSKASTLAKHATASLGKFAHELPKEKKPKNSGIKRKFESNLSDLPKEKERNLEIMSKLINKKPKLDEAKAVEYGKPHMAKRERKLAKKEAREAKSKPSKKTSKQLNKTEKKSNKSTKKFSNKVNRNSKSIKTIVKNKKR